MATTQKHIAWSRFGIMFVVLVAFFTFFGCVKSILNSHEPEAVACFIKQTRDDYFGDIFDFEYDHAGKLIAIKHPEVIAKIIYDYTARPLKIEWGENGSRYEFSYEEGMYFPTRMQTFMPDFDDAVTTDSFFYDQSGRIKRETISSIPFPHLNYIREYEYDERGNVTHVLRKEPDRDLEFTEFRAIKYDDKPNFWGGNRWLRYLLKHAGFLENEIWFHSTNNLVKWLWMTGDEGERVVDINHNIEYNTNGFANKITQHYYVLGAGRPYKVVTRTSRTTCDL